MRETFEDYVKEVSKWVGGNRQKRLIEEELSDHLEDNFERFRAMGFSEAEAEQKAVQCMGKKEELRHAFAELYPINPASYWKKSLYLIFFGMMYSFLQMDLSLPYLGLMVRILSLLLFGVGLFRLRELDKSLKISFGLFVTSACLAAVWGPMMHYFVPSEAVSTYIKMSLFGGLVGFFLLLSYGFLFYGMEKTAWTYRTQRERSPYLWLSGLAFCILQIFFWYVTFSQIPSGEFQSIAFMVLPIASVVALLFLALSFFRFERIIGSGENSVDVLSPPTKKEYTLFSAAAVFLLVLSLGLTFGATYRQPHMEQLPEAEETALLPAAEKLKEMGLPETYLADLPEVEIERLANASHMEQLPNKYGLSIEEQNKARDAVTLEAYVFYFCDEDGHVPKIRVLYCYSGFENRTAPYRNALLLSREADDVFVDWSAPEKDGKPSADALCYTAAADVNGKRYCCAPFANGDYENGVGTQYYAEFAFPKQGTNCRAYLSVTLWRRQYSGPEILSTSIEFLRQKLPIPLHQYSMHAYAANELPQDWNYEKYRENFTIEIEDNA